MPMNPYETPSLESFDDDPDDDLDSCKGFWCGYCWSLVIVTATIEISLLNYFFHR